MKQLINKLFFLNLIFFNYLIANNLSNNKNNFCPKISIITCVYNDDAYIAHFLENITKQTVFDQCEWIIIDANSPGKEKIAIRRYAKKYKNIIYKILKKDPGLYAVWNIAIKLAKGKYITNANPDDRLAYNCYEIHSDVLDKNKKVSLVFSDCYITRLPNESMDNFSYMFRTKKREFVPRDISRGCVPSFNPMWRRSVHDVVGYFDENMKIAADYEMWVKLIAHKFNFKKAPGINGLYYWNDNGVSLSKGNFPLLEEERKTIKRRYPEIFKK